jgi:hypothetical protein
MCAFGGNFIVPTLGKPCDSPASGGRRKKHIELVSTARNWRRRSPKLAHLLQAKKVEAYAGYSSAFEFDSALLNSGTRKKRRAKAAMAH